MMNHSYSKKIKIVNYNEWKHHRHGWKRCIVELEKHLGSETGTLTYPNDIVKIIGGLEVPKTNWIGFLHLTKTCIEQLHVSKKWLKSKDKCKGLFVLCDNVVDDLKKKLEVPVQSILHPCEHQTKFNFEQFQANSEKKLIFIGYWLRRLDIFNRLKVPTGMHKTLLAIKNMEKNITDKTIQILPYQSEYEYDELLSKNLVFLELIDSSCNNTILECLLSNTPIFVNRLPATELYLGKDYPLFCDSINEVESKLNIDKIYLAHKYLSQLDKSKFSYINFVLNVYKSDIYKSL